MQQGAMHVHRARTRVKAAGSVLVTAQLALSTRIKTKEGKARAKNAVLGRQKKERRFVKNVQLANISKIVLALLVQLDIPASMDKNRALNAWEENIPT